MHVHLELAQTPLLLLYLTEAYVQLTTILLVNSFIYFQLREDL